MWPRPGIHEGTTHVVNPTCVRPETGRPGGQPARTPGDSWMRRRLAADETSGTGLLGHGDQAERMTGWIGKDPPFLRARIQDLVEDDSSPPDDLPRGHGQVID